MQLNNLISACLTNMKIFVIIIGFETIEQVKLSKKQFLYDQMSLFVY